ncbi:class E sortase [Streptomyces sp. A3M-1-3]|uniref:class E sortase n=1 Tax=Streptomyces sp. A3M-1-3 TaxID=2962044 RepID=UPI0020B7353B|nr:class E sortase [Streptomyces sp. A3M-1-3]MCP3821492.1 class E sortase [Streptomyces sp. A3M-1-3]
MTVRLIVRTFSEVCITAGTLTVLFVAYVVFWTGVKADTAMDGEIGRLRERWEQTPVPIGTDEKPSQAAELPTPTRTPPPPPPYREGRPFAVMYIPRFGEQWHKPVLEGTGTGTLKKGLGHYARTARLGETGNFSVAGHRRTYGDPFKDFPKLRPGDAVVLTDGTTWFTYRIVRKPYRTLPSDVGVIDPVPGPLQKDAAGFKGPGRYLTLTTCEPEWGHSHRLIAWAYMDATQPVAEGKPEALRS